jgi:hypothetical protein
VIVLADVPEGWSRSHTPTAGTSACSRRLGLAKPATDRVGKVFESPDNGNFSMKSEALVYADTDAATTAFAVLTGHRYVACFRKDIVGVFQKAFTDNGARVTSTSRGQVSIRPVGDAVKGWRFRIGGTTTGFFSIPFTVYVDWVLVRTDREITGAFGFGTGKPLKTATLRHALARASQRTRQVLASG